MINSSRAATAKPATLSIDIEHLRVGSIPGKGCADRHTGDVRKKRNGEEDRKNGPDQNLCGKVLALLVQSKTMETHDIHADLHAADDNGDK